MATKEELEFLRAQPRDVPKCKEAVVTIHEKVIQRIEKGFKDQQQPVPENLRKRKKFFVGSMETYNNKISVVAERTAFQRFRRGEEPATLFPPSLSKKRGSDEAAQASSTRPSKASRVDLTGDNCDSDGSSIEELN